MPVGGHQCPHFAERKIMECASLAARITLAHFSVVVDCKLNCVLSY
jgi:hypothetical protein